MSTSHQSSQMHISACSSLAKARAPDRQFSADSILKRINLDAALPKGHCE